MWNATAAHAQYVQRHLVTTHGAVTFIGNTLGLNKDGINDRPGTTGSIGTFTTTNTNVREDFEWPLGTTLDWRQNSSAAILSLPPASRVVRAELIWGGSYNFAGENVSFFLNDPVEFRTPAGLSQVTPAVATRFTLSGPQENYYTRTADVTALVTAGGNGTYTVGRVPATQGNDADFNAAGWTLAVLYENSTLPARNLSLFVGLERVGGSPVSVASFCTPTTGPVRGRVAVSAIDGDTHQTGDSLRFGPNIPSLFFSQSRLAGPNNPITNFFASQINGDDGLLVTSGTHGTRNNTFGPGSPPGGRQGWDITNVDASAQLTPGQTTAFAVGTTSFEFYYINALALQIDVGAPALDASGAFTVSHASAKVGDILTYTARFDNSEGGSDANNATITVPLPAGMSFVPGSFTLDGAASGANPVTGALIGTVAAGATRVVTFRFRVDSVPAAPALAQYDVTPTWTYTYVSCTGQPPQPGSFTMNTASTTIARIAAAKSALPQSVRPAQMIDYRVSVTNTGTAASNGTLVRDPIPAGTSYVPGSTTLNGILVADQQGTSPLVLGMLVHSPGAGPGIVNPGEAADVRFIVRVDASTTAAIVNTALIEPDGLAGLLPEIPVAVTTLVTPTAEIELTNVGPVTATAGTQITYIITVTNQGPSTANDVVLTNPTPPGLTLVSVTGDCTTLPCSLGAIEAGAGFLDGSGRLLVGQRVVNVTFSIPGNYTTPDPIVTIASATTTTQDLTPGDDAASASTALSAPVADLHITNSNGVNRVVPGATVTYQIVVTNAGPSNAMNAVVTDVFPAALTGVTWSCGGQGATAFCGAATGTGNINTPVTVDTTGSVIFTATGTLATTASGTLVNEASAVPPAGTSDPTPAAEDDIDTIDLQADLSITLGGPSSVALGGEIVYTSTITNNGPSEASNVVIEVDNTPDLIFVSSTSPCTTTPCNIGTLAPGATRTDTTTFRVPLDSPGDTITSTTRLSSGVEDPDTTDNESVAVVAIIRDADVALVKSVSPETVVVGEQATFIVTVTNAGPAPATAMVVRDLLPEGLVLDSFSASQGSYVPATGEWTVGDVDVGRFATLSLVAILEVTGAVTNLATIAARGQPDPNPSNDSAAVEVNGLPAADIAVTKSVDNLAPPVGSTVTFTVMVTNNGPNGATGVVVRDSLPAGLTLVSATPLQGDYTAPDWNVGTVNPGLPATLIIVATVDAAGGLVNRAAKTLQVEADPNIANDSASVTLNAAESANLKVLKAATRSTASVGETLTFNVLVINQGQSPTTGVGVSDVLPPGLTFVSANPAAAYDATTGIWTVGELGVGGYALLALNVRVTQPGTLINTASIAASDLPDPDATDNAASATVTAAVNADVGVAQAFTGATTPGLAAGYTIVVTNHGPSDVAGATVTDTFPPAFIGVTWTCAADPGSSCAAAAGNGSIATTVTLQAGGTATFTVGATLDAGAIGTLLNTVTVAVPPGVTDADATNDSATTSVLLTPAADLQITKDGPTSAVAGTNVTYTTVVTNAGPSVAVAVTVTDPTPPGLTFLSNASACATAFPCALGTLAVGAVHTITTTYAIPSGYVAPDPITNTATVASDTPDPAAANNSRTATTGLGDPVTDLRLTKTNGVSSLVPGQTTTYTITLTNNGPTDAIGARIQDLFPAALSGVSWTCTASGGGTCGAASGSGDLDIAANVPVGVSVVVTATGTVAANATGLLVNTATAVPPVGLRVRSTPSATDTDELLPQADLSVTKTGPASVLLGDAITYTITVANAGPSDASDVLVKDLFQNGLAFVSNTGDCTTAFPCALGTVPAGATRTITATFLVPVGYAGPSPLANFAEVTATTPDLDVLDNTATAETAVDRGADVGVVKSVSPAMVLVGEQATFTVTVTNAGPARAQGLVVRDLLPEGLTLDSSVVLQGSYAPATGDWTVGAVDAGQSATLTLVATLEVAGAVTNFAAITATDQPDPNPSNDSAAVEVNGQAAADIAVTKTVDNPTPTVGSTVTFTVKATNRGPNGATGVVVSDALPAGLTLVSATPLQGDYTAPTWTVGAVAVDASATLIIVATVDTPGGLVNKAEKTQQVEADPTTANDSASVTLNAAASANLKILKAATRSTVSVGETLTFNALVVNLGPGPATGVRVSDVLPPGLTFVSAKPAGAYNPTTGIWTVGALDANAPAVLTLTVLVTQAGALTNTASIIASDQPDPDLSDNTDSATVTAVVTAEVGVAQVFTGATTPGLAAGYTIVVTNQGPSSVAGVTVTDLLPAVLVSPSWTCVADAGSSCAAAAGAGSLATTVTLRAGATATFTVGATIAAGATGTLVNTVTVAVPPGVIDGDATNDSATTSVPLTPAADLQISKDGPASAVAGTNVVYTTVVTNAGPSDALAVTVADPTPPGLTFVSNAVACTTAFPCALGTLAAGAVSTITTTYAIPPGYLTPAPIVNTATVASATPDPAAANDSSTAMTEIGASVTDLRIAKTNGVSSLVPGQPTTYTITVTNNGPSNAIGARVQDLFPAALTGVSWTCSGTGGGACGTASGTGNIDIAVDVPVGATVVVTATGTVAANATGLLVNTATAVPPAGLAFRTTATATDTDELVPQADLSVTKTGATSVVPGTSIVYTTTVTNTGLSDAAGVTVADVTPAGLTFVSNTGDCTTAFPCALGAVPAGATRTITTTFSVPLAYSGPSPIVNVATVSATTPDPDGSDNTATVQTAVNRDADVRVVKSVSPAAVLAGEQATFTITVSNAGPARAQGLVVRDLLPVGLTLDSFDESQGSYAPASGTWTVGTLDAGQSATLTLVATLTVAGEITNLAVITAKDQLDPDPSNNVAAAVVNGQPAADIAVTKTADNPAPAVGTTVTFIVTATNRGPTGATGVIVTDALPAGLTQVSATPSQGTYTAPTWTVGALAANASATLVIAATVDTPGALVNTAAKTQQVEADPNATNDSASVTLNAAASANLKILKAATRATVSVGETLTFNVLVVNVGPSPATGVRVSDVLPPGLTFVSANPAAEYDALTGVWTVGDLAVHAPALLALTVRASQPGALTNTASIAASDQPDPDPSDNAASATVTAAIAADVGVTTAFTGAPTPGAAAGYTIVVTNHGPSDVAGVTVTDVLPAVLVAPSWTCVADAGSSCAAAAGTGSIATTVTLQAGDTATFTVTGTIAASTTGTLVNTVTVAVPAGVTDGDATNDTATTSVPLTPAADLQISKAGPIAAVAGTNVVYTTVVTNAGPSDAAAVSVADPTPSGLTFVSNAGACLTAFPCTLGTLAVGAVSTITTTYAIPPGYLTPDPIVNTATVASATLDPAAANNSSTATTGLGAAVTDLLLTKTNGVSSLVPGQTTTYTITLTNNGPSDAINSRLQDDFPAALTGVSWTCAGSGGGTCGAASGSGDIDIAVDVPVGATVVVTATGTVAANATGFLVNTATAVPPAGLAVRSTATATDTDQLLPQADLSVTKVGPASVVPGTSIVYTTTITNNGPSDAAGVTVADATPAGLTFVSNAGDCTTAFPCALGAVPAGATRTISTTFSVPVAYSGPSPIVNVATVSATTPDPDGSDNTATAQTAVNRDADVRVVKSVSPATVLVGEQATFTVTVSNAGPAHAQGLVVRDLLPVGLTLDSSSVTQGSYVEATGDWTVGALNAGQSATLTLVATLEVTGVVTNLATITAKDQPDPDTSNDSSAADVNGAPAADIAVTKTVDNPTPVVGTTVTFTVTTTNRGPTGATGVVVTDALPVGLTLVSATPSQGDYTAPAWTVGAIAVDASATLVIVATVDAPGALVNRAEKTQQVEADPNITNDSASVTLNAAASANLKILKAATRATVSVGETLTFHVVVVNLGPSPATGVRVSDVLPPGLTFVSANPAAAYDGPTGIWTVGDLAVDAPAVLALTVRATQAGALTNTASIVASGQPDPDPTDNAASATVTAAITADVGVAKTFTGATTPGLAAGYTIVVTNLGPSDVAGVTVTDLLPAVLVAPSWTCVADAGSSCAAAAGTGSIATTVTLQAGDTATFTVTATIAAGGTGTLVNTATVAVPAGVIDGDATNDSATTSVPLTPAADLQISKVGPASAAAGTNIVYTTVVTNAGPSDAVGVTVTDPTPPGLTFVSNAGACLTAFPCALGTLASGAVGTITTTYAIPAAYVTPAPIVNTATVASGTPDPVAANNSSTATTALGASVTDLRIAKTNGVSFVAPGQTTTYTITVTNNGPSNAIGARVQDVFPAALTGVSWTCAGSAGGACGIASGTGNIDIAVDVPVGASVVVTATGTVAANATGFLVNTATAVPPAGLVARTTATATDTDELVPQADLSVTKTGPASVVPGTSIVYTITVTNTGLSDAAGVTLADGTPAGLTFVSNAGDCTTAFPCALGAVPAGATRTITTTFSVPVGYAGPSPITNVAAVSATTADPDGSDNTATAQTAVNRDADVRVVKSVTPATVLAGQPATFTVTVTNAGPARASGLVVHDPLPGGLTFVSATPTQGSYASATGQWTVGALDVGQSATLTIVATLQVAGEITNFAAITARDQPDPDPSNDVAAAVVNGQPAADVAVTKTVDNPAPAVGTMVTFILTATNRGPTAATGVVVTDALPAGLTLVSATPSQGGYTAPTWTVGALATNASATLIIVATVDTPGALVNTATKTVQVEADPNPANDSASVTLNAAASANLKILKATTRPTVSVGETLTFYVLVLNLGPSPATGVRVSDVLPTGLTFVSANPAAEYDALTGVWTVGDLDVRGPAALALTVRVTQAGALTNTASIAAVDQPDPDATNNAASATVTAAAAADVSVTQAFTGSTTPGLAAGYAIVVTNLGPTDVAGVTVTDLFPPIFTGITWTCTASAGSTCASPSGVGAIGTTVTLEAGDTAIFTVAGSIAASATGTLVNTATAAVPAGVTDSNATNNSATTSVILTPAADVQIVKNGPISTAAGTNVVYTTVITNAGPSDAAAVSVADPTPPGLTFVSNASACATAFPCALGTLAAGAVGTITTTYAIPAAYVTPDPIVNTTTVASATPDHAAANNSSTAMTGLGVAVTDLRIAKTNGVSSLAPGQTTTYTITLTNNGPSNANGVRVTDVFPAALTGVSWTCAASGGGACGGTTGTGNLDIAADVPVGATVVVTATGTVAANATGFLVNTATAVPPAGLAVQSTPTATDTDQLLPQADLSVTKAGPASVVLGGSITYAITVANAGPSDAAGVTVADPTPEGLTFVSNAGDCTTAFPCMLGAVPAGATRTITATFSVPVGYAGPSPVANVAEVSATTADPDASNNTATAETSLNGDADVEVTKAVPASDVLIGDEIVITINALNHGPNPATGIEITDQLPAGFDFVSASATQGAYDAATGIWSVGSLEVGAAEQLTMTVLVMEPGPTTNLAAKTDQNEPDPNTSNDSAAGSTAAAPAADLAVEKHVDRRVAPVGETVIFTVHATNRGPSPATAVALTDALPAGLSFVSATASQGSYDQVTGIWTVGVLDAVAQATLTLVARVDQPGALANNASMASQDQVDPNPLNNSDAESVNAAPAADLRVTKAVSGAAPGVGALATYTIAVTNLGPDDATSADVRDVLPAGVAFVSASASQGSYDAGTGIWTLGAVPVTRTEILTLTGRVTEPGTRVNTATRQSSTPVDPNAANDTGTATLTSSIIADLSLTKTPSVPAAAAGTAFTWTVAVVNNGPSSAVGAAVTDAFPVPFTGVTWTCTASSGSRCAAPSGAGTIASTVDLLAGGSATFVATGLSAPNSSGLLANVAMVVVAAGTTDPDTTNNSDTSAVGLASLADVQVTQAGPSVLAPGTSGDYLITIANVGPSQNVSTTLILPTSRGSSVPVTIRGACSSVPCELGQLAPGDLREVIATLSPPADYSGPPALIVIAVALSDPFDPLPENNRASVVTAITEFADLSITKTGPTSAGPGQRVTYAMTVTNAGPSVATGVTVDDPTPAGLTWVSTSGDCTITFPCDLGTMAPGTTRTITATYTVAGTAAPPDITNAATVHSGIVDPNSANNSATISTRIRTRAKCDVDGDGLDEIVTGAGPLGGPHVRVFKVSGGTVTGLASFYAYEPTFTGGAFVACGDVTGDGIAEVITGPGAGGAPLVRVFDVAGGTVRELVNFYPYDPAFIGGVHVAAADTTGDGIAEIITGAGPLGGPHVRVFEFNGGALTQQASFYAYDPAFTGGVFVAGGDVDGDGQAEVITGAGPSGGPHVRVISLRGGTLTELTSFYAYDPAFIGGVHVAAADTTGDGVDEIVTGAGPLGGPHVLVIGFDGANLTVLKSFYAYDPAFVGGASVAGGDVTGDGIAEIITGAEAGGGPHVLVIDVSGGGLTGIASFYAYNPAFVGGVHVAAAETLRDGEVAAVPGFRGGGITSSLVAGLTGSSRGALAQRTYSSPAQLCLSPNGRRRRATRASPPRHRRRLRERR